MASSPAIALTVDVEDYFQVEAFARLIDKNKWSEWTTRVEDNTRRLLDLFKRHHVHGTFFVLGWVAERFPELVRDISIAGHEVASHGYDHKIITTMSREEFRDDLRKSKEILESITGSRINGYRAPTFSIVQKTAWAHGVLIDEGYSYSSSVYPILHDRYGWPEFGQVPRKIVANGRGELWEIPMSVASLCGIKIPFGGGGYLRAYPLSLTSFLIGKNMRMNRTCVLYVHPWEIDPGQPVVETSFINRFRHYNGIKGMQDKLSELLNKFDFIRISDLIKSGADLLAIPDGKSRE